MTSALTELIAQGQAGDEEARGKASEIVLLELQRRKRRYTHLTNATVRIGDQFDWGECRRYLVNLAQQYRRALIEQTKCRSSQQPASDRDEDNYLAIDVTAVDAALTALESKDPSVGEAMLLRYFGGHDNAEIATIMGLPQHTADALVQFGKAALSRFMKSATTK